MELLGQNKVDHRQRKVAIVSQDSFYRVLTPEQKAKALKGQYNFDHPGRSFQRGHIPPRVFIQKQTCSTFCVCIDLLTLCYTCAAFIFDCLVDFLQRHLTLN